MRNCFISNERRTISFLDFLIVETLEGFLFYISCCISALKKSRNRTRAEINARRVMFDILLAVIFRNDSYSLIVSSSISYCFPIPLNSVSCMHLRSSVLKRQVYFQSQCFVIVNI